MLHAEAVATDSSRSTIASSAPKPSGRATRAFEWADRQSAALERRGVLLFAAMSILYWAVTVLLAARKMMWNDELYTYYVATLGSMGDVWGSLLTGGEQTPPFFYFLTRIAFDLFGTGHLAIRLPAMLGFWTMSVCLLVVVARRTSWFPALCAAAFPLVTMAYYYALEARAYGVVLGFSALGLLAWQSLAMGRRRLLWLLCLAVSLSAAVSSHYYAVFVIVALATGEAVRTLATRRVDLAIWCALAAPAAPLALHLPLIRAGQRYSGAFWAPPQWVNIPDFYTHLLGPGLMAGAILLVVAVVHAWFASSRPGEPAGSSALPSSAAELTAALAFIAIPFMSVLLAKIATGAFTHRYAMPAVIGFAMFVGFGSAAVFRRQPLMRAVTLACIVGWFALSQAREYVEPTGFSMPVTAQTVSRPVDWLKTAPAGDLPLVVSDPHTFAVLSHYGAPELKSRIVYLADPDLALKHLGHNSVERGMVDLLKPWFRMNVVEFEPFLADHPRFLVYGDFFRMAFLNWIEPELHERGIQIQLLNRAGDNLFLMVTRSGSQ